MSRPIVVHTFNTAPTKVLAKKLNLTFDKKFAYCISDAHKNDIGKNIPSYMFDGYNKIYRLKYFDGCFNPYLQQLSTDGFSFINDGKDVIYTIIYTDDAMNRLRIKNPNV
jgi:hypothetical protein